MRRCFKLVVSAAFCAAVALGQVGVSGSNGVSGSAQFALPLPFLTPAVTGAPYAGEEISEQVQTLADGTHITRKSPATRVYRDSMGRTRTERQANGELALAGQVQDSAIWIEITDPVARVKYLLDPSGKVAHRQQLPAPPQLPPRVPPAGVGVGTKGMITNPVGTMGDTFGGVIVPAGTAARRLAVRPQMSHERLGTQTMEGVLAEGTRTTLIYPVDSQGNDRPISVVTETWMSPELKVSVLRKSSDPRTGDRIQKLTNIIVGEPPATLFQPPPEYTVVDEIGAFLRH